MIGASRRSRLQNCGFIHDLDRFACRRSLPGGYSFRKITLTESGASRLDLSRRPTCCTTQQRPTNIRPFRRSTGWPNTRPQVLERFVRHLQYAAGIGWLQANTFGRSSATLTHVSLLGLFCSAPGARSASALHPVRKTATEPLRKLDRASSDAHRNLRVPLKTFGFRTPLGVRRQSLQTRTLRGSNSNPSGLVAPTGRSARQTSVFHPCVITAKEPLRKLIGTFGLHSNLLEIQKPTLQSCRLAAIELIH